MELESEVVELDVETEEEYQEHLEENGWKTKNLSATTDFPLYGWKEENIQKFKELYNQKTGSELSDILDCCKEFCGSGLPDILAVKEDRFLFIEIKFEGDGLRKSQFEWMKDNRDLPCKVVYIV